jgi:hypothetical protein
LVFVAAAADMPVNRAEEAEVKAMENPITFAAEAATRIQGLLEKTKEALASMHRLVFPKLPQDKKIAEMAEAFTVGGAARVEVQKRNSRLHGALLSFQLMLGYGLSADFEEMLQELPKDADGAEVNLGQFQARARDLALQLIELVDASKARRTSKDAPSASVQTAV